MYLIPINFISLSFALLASHFLPLPIACKEFFTYHEKKSFDCYMYSPCKHQRICIVKSMEKMDTDVFI